MRATGKGGNLLRESGLHYRIVDEEMGMTKKRVCREREGRDRKEEDNVYFFAFNFSCSFPYFFLLINNVSC